MGAVCTTPELQTQTNLNKQIERKLNKERKDELGNQKLLLLGLILHKNGFTEAEIDDKRAIIYSNTITGMSNLLRALPQLGYCLELAEREMDAKRILSLVDCGKDSQPLTPDIYDALKNLWNDRSVQKAFTRRSEYQMGDSVAYFMEHLDRIYAPNYRPTVQDILHTRVPTAGVVQNRLMESMDLFAQICNSKWFLKASMILFLNKKDLFIEKIRIVPIKVLFESYDGDNSYESSVAYVKKRFNRLNENKHGKKIYIHETCATDTNQVQLVIDSVVDTVIGKNLKGAGME
ncbi:unnamed protein product [Anisakis simplex]|uniref:Guanine nucleotide-binding protein alpha-15 subunit (inferred by orthology to a C. elegans protein) n=1 Tax=Anisakis simplex TaxID=6269 RepID=A0A0M3K5B1_ANISI|nr:unnamed protein product [Anisakis simplex]